MKALDRFLQRWRIHKALAFIPPDARVLDVGCADGALFHVLGTRIKWGIGIDPGADSSSSTDRFRFVRGTFPDDMPCIGPVNVICMLAVLEHIPPERTTALRHHCERLLRPGGRLILSVPSPIVDKVLAVMRSLHMVDTETLEEHHGFAPQDAVALFTSGPFRLIRQARFQAGLNNLFVFERTE